MTKNMKGPAQAGEQKRHFCIFCDNELNKATKPEHILLSALGGRKTTKRANCSDCNNLFGGTIDRSIADQVPMLRNMFQMESGTGKPPPGQRNVRSGDDRINLSSDGVPELIAQPFTVEDLGNGDVNIQIMVGSPEEFERIVPHIAARLKKSEDEIWDMIEKAQGKRVTRHANPIHVPLSFGGTDPIRSITKSCLALLATKTGSEPLKADPFADARKFVLEGSNAFNKTRVSFDQRPLPEAELLERRYGPVFNLICVGSDEAGRTIGHFTLYNLVGWQVVLAEAGGPASLKIGLVSNPLKPADWDDDIAKEIDVGFDWLSRPDPTDHLKRASERIEAALKFYVDRGREQEIGRIVDQVASRYFRPDERIVDEERTKQAIDEMSNRVAHMVMGLPFEEPLKIERPKKP